jgi:hypothetical protein
MMPPASIRDRILEAARKEPAPTRDRARDRRRMALSFGVAIALASFALVGSMGPLPRPFLFACGAGWSLVAFVGTLVGLSRGQMMLGRSTRALVATASAIAPVVLAWILMLVFYMQPPHVAPPMHVHLVCCAMGIAFAAAPLGAMLWIRRGTDPVHPAATGATLGSAAGAWGGLLIHLHCPYVDPAHVVAGHVLPIVLLAIAGALAGRRLLVVR